MKLALFGGKPVRAQPFTAWPIFGQAEEKRLLRTLRSGKWGRLDGPEVAEFEERFAAMHGCKHGLAVANGTVSLRIALMAKGIRAQDEVIIPPYTFFSTASAVVEANAIPRKYRLLTRFTNVAGTLPPNFNISDQPSQISNFWEIPVLAKYRFHSPLTYARISLQPFVGLGPSFRTT